MEIREQYDKMMADVERTKNVSKKMTPEKFIDLYYDNKVDLMLVNGKIKVVFKDEGRD